MADGEFSPDQWDEGQYSKAKSLLAHDFEDPAKGERLRAAVSRYEATRGSDAAFTAAPAARPAFEEPDAADATGLSAAGGRSVEATPLYGVRESATAAEPHVTAAGGGMGVPPAVAGAYNKLSNLPRNAWEALQESAGDAVTSFANSAYRGFGDDALAALGRGDDAESFKRDVERAKERSPVGSFVGGGVPDAIYGTALTALGAGPAVVGGALGGSQAAGESEHHGARRALDTGVGAVTGAVVGKAIDAAPAAAKYVGGKLAKTGKRSLELGDEYLARAIGATADDIQKIVKKPGGRERLADLVNTAREQGINKGVLPPSLREVEERATAKAAEHGAKKDAIYSSVDNQALVDSLALKNRIKRAKNKYAEGGPVGQPMRDKVDEIAEKFGQMKHVEREPLAYHTTPSENFSQIAEKGLLPSEGGKNYGLPKNKGVMHFGVDSPEKPLVPEMQRWLSEVGDAADPAAGEAGGKAMSMLRTSAPVQTPPPKYGPQGQVYQSGRGIKIRTEPTPPDAIEYLDPDEGVWRAITDYGKPKLPRGEAPLSYERPAPQWYEDDQPLLALAENAGPSSTGSALGQAEASGLGGANVHARADVFPPSDPSAALGRVEAAGMTGGGGAPPRVTPEMLNAEVMPRARRGIPMGEMRKELGAWGDTTNFPSDSPEQRLRQHVYGAMNAEMRGAAAQVMPGADEALRREAWNEHAAITFKQWAQRRAIRESNNRIVSPTDLGAGAVGGILGIGAGNPAAGVGLGTAINRTIRGREHGVAERAMNVIGNRGGAARGSGVEALGNALQEWNGRPTAALMAGSGSGSGAASLAGRIGAAAQEPEQEKRASAEARGHLTADAARQLLQTNPQALGAYAHSWQKALDEGPAAVSALMQKLEHDPSYERTTKRALQDATRTIKQ